MAAQQPVIGGAINFIDLQKDYAAHANEFDTAIKKVLTSARFVLGPEVTELEASLAKFVDVKHCITVGNGTIALMVALQALGVGPNDEVITTPFTWISTPHAISLIGAKPVFVDILPDTYNIDPSKIEKAITSRTRAIMPVSLFGQMADMTQINAIAAKHRIPVIEDAAQSFGAAQNGRQSCGVSTISCTSFYPAKPLGCFGEGGAIFTNDDQLASKCRALRTNGAEVRHNHVYIGYNARLETVQAAVLQVKLKHFPEQLRIRSMLGMQLTNLLSGSGVNVPKIMEGNSHTYAQYTIRVPARDAVMKKLSQLGIPSSIYYPVCCHLQPCYKDLGLHRGSFPIAEALSQTVLSLPFHPYLSGDDIQKIANAVQQAVGGQRLTERLNMASYVHPTAIIDDNVSLGHGSKVWHFVHVSKDATIGNHCNFGQNCFIGNGVTIGNNVRVQNNVSVYSGVVVHDDVFLGPSMVFTNDFLPRSGINKDFLVTTVCKGASIGANATIVCGHTVGEYSMIGAGAVLTHDAEPYGLYVGVPARQVGWVSQYGEKLNLPLKSPASEVPVYAMCPKSNKKYQLLGGKVSPCPAENS